MKTFIWIFITFGMISCGADPDDFQAQESDGCRSDDTQCQEEAESKAVATSDPIVTETDNPDEFEVEVAVDVKVRINTSTKETTAAENCQAGKLCRGMTTSEVQGVIGDPTTLSEPFVGKGVDWEYREPHDTNHYCVDTVWVTEDKCFIRFREVKVDGETVELLRDVEDIHGQWLDPVNF